LPIRIGTQPEYENERAGSCIGSFVDVGIQPDEAVDSRNIKAMLGHQLHDIVMASFKRFGQHPECWLCTMLQQAGDELGGASATSVRQDRKIASCSRRNESSALSCCGRF
jgi:hypothetical protein